MRRAISFLVMIGVCAMFVACKQAHQAAPDAQTTHGLAKVSAKVLTAVPPPPESCMALEGNSGRDRGWCLFEYLTGNGTDPIWADWTAIPNEGVGKVDCGQGALLSGSTQGRREILSPIFQAKPEMKILRTLAPPTEVFRQRNGAKGAFGMEPLHAPNSEVFKQDDPKSDAAAAVVYNDALKNAMCGMRHDVPLDTALSTLDGVKKLNQGSGVYLAVKTVWAVVPAPLPSLTVWDGQRPEEVSSEGIQKWGTSLQLDDTQPTPACKFADVNRDKWPPAGPEPKKISPSCFHSLSLTPEQLKSVFESFPPNETVAHNPSGTADRTYLLLLGFHVIAKVPGGEWTWQTFWWSAAATKSEVRFHNGNTRTKPGEWRNYVMITEEESNAQHSAFNPYLEAPLHRGGHSDCVACHARARYYTTAGHTAGQLLDNFSAALFCALRGPGDKQPCVPPPPGGVGTDSLWSLADSNIRNLGHGDGGNSP